MFIGVAVHYRFQKLLGNVAAIGIIAALFVVFCALARPAIYGPDFSVILPVNYGPAALVFISCAVLPASLFSARLLNFAAEISYPLYIVHGVNGYILMRALAGVGVPTKPVHPACRVDGDKCCLPSPYRSRTADAPAGTSLGARADGVASEPISDPQYPKRNGHADRADHDRRWRSVSYPPREGNALIPRRPTWHTQ